MMLRSLLFLPGNSPGMLVNGTVLPADALILDLEDAVAPDQKDAARDLVKQALTHLDYGDNKIVIRINALDTDFWERDLEALVPLKPFAIMPPKVDGAPLVHRVSEKIAAIEKAHDLPEGSTKLIPLLETARGVAEAVAIADSDPRVIALFLGAEDYTADLGAERTKEGEEIFFARSQIVLAAKAAGILALDTPFTDARDDAGLKKDALKAKSLGFTGKASISPHHLEGIHEVFSPTDEDIHYAFEVLAAIAQGQKEGKGAVSLRGKMIDKPIVMRAERTLGMARDLGRLDAEALKLFADHEAQA